MNGFPILVLAAALIAPGADRAGPSVPLVTFDDLQHRIGEPHVRLLDTRPEGEYDKGHIPGAVRIDAKAVEKMAAKPGRWPTAPPGRPGSRHWGSVPTPRCWSTTPIVSSTPPGFGGCFAISEWGKSD